jgi:hypothetical protein
LRIARSGTFSATFPQQLNLPCSQPPSQLRTGSCQRVRQAELGNRCFADRGLHTSSTTVVGIATEQYSPDGFSLDLCQVQLPKWGTEQQAAREAMQADLGYFVNSRKSVTTCDEYPRSPGDA